MRSISSALERRVFVQVADTRQQLDDLTAGHVDAVKILVDRADVSPL